MLTRVGVPLFFLGCVSAPVAALAWLGLWDKNFVSLGEYLNGDWGANIPA